MTQTPTQRGPIDPRQLTRRSRCAWAVHLTLWAASVAMLGSCGNAEPVRIVLAWEGGSDPFEGLAEVRISVSSPDLLSPLQERRPYRSGAELHLSLSVPVGTRCLLSVEGIDADDLVVARGESGPFALRGDEPQQITVSFARCPLLRFPDRDRDGFGDQAVPKTLCGSFDGFVAAGGDCADADEDAHPSEPGFFTRQRAGVGGYDFNCDQQEERELNTAISCAALGADICRGNQGWIAAVPACGEGGQWARCTKNGPDCLVESTEARLQACR